MIFKVIKQRLTELMETPPQANISLSMFLFLALLRARIPSLANKSSDKGSIPFWLMITKVLSGVSQTWTQNQFQKSKN